MTCIQDFRSENGLYALLQAQYDAAAREKQAEEDIDNRPTKRRKLDRSRSTSSLPMDRIEADKPSIRRILRSSHSFSVTTAPSTENKIDAPRATRRKPIPDAIKSSPRGKRNLRRQSSSPTMNAPVETDEPPSSQTSTTSSTRHSLPNLKGKDLFDSIIWSNALSTSIFYTFISSLRQKILNDVKSTTETHKFIRALRDAGRLVRNYTQNIDMLESREGLCTELERGTGNRTRFSQKFQREPRPTDETGTSTPDSGVEVVHLHGSLDKLRCGLCAKPSSWDEDDRHQATLAGEAPDCPWCVANSANREGKGRRSLAVGRLRPDIVLYGEEHPSAHLVAPLITHDLSLGPDILLILGTSLRVHGLKVMVREFAKAVHGKGGKVVFVNMTKPPESIWGDVIDYWVEWDCDAWVIDLKERRKEIWLPLGAPNDASSKEEKPRTVAKNPAATRPDVTNGAYLTMKIVDQLGRISGRISDTANHVQSDEQQSTMPTTTEEGSKKRKKSSPPRPQAVRPNKENGAYLVFEIINNLRRLCAGWVTNPAINGKLPLGTISANIYGRPKTRVRHTVTKAHDLPEIPTPPNSDQATPPLTPGTQRIKSLGSISAILSSPLRYWRDR
jgi:NAD-dependent SIR2 family protein deacetylase